MIDIKITGLEELKATLTGFSDRRFAAAIATALTRTAVKTRDAVKADMRKALDRPTPYTLNQVRYVAANANSLTAGVGFNVVGITDAAGKVLRYADLGSGQTPAGRYMQPQIEGGGRSMKRLEVALRAINALPAGMVAVPGAGAKLDAYGNVSRGQVVQVLSQLRVQLVAGTDRNMSQDARKQIAAQRRAGGRFFVVKPGAGRQPGIYQREFYGRNVTPVFVFVKSARYRKRFDFDGSVAKAVTAHMPVEVDKALTEAVTKAARAAT